MQVRTPVLLLLAMAGVSLSSAETGRIPPLRPLPPEAKEALTWNPQVAVLGYGAIGKGNGALPEAAFRQQMSYLQHAGLKPVSLADFLAWRAGLGSLPPQSVLLTFEQVDAAFVQEVFPILRACGYPFVLFVDAKKLGSGAGGLSVRDLQMMVRLGGSVGCVCQEAEGAKRWKNAELKGGAAVKTLAETELGTPARILREACGNCDVYLHDGAKADVQIVRQLVRQGYAAAFSRTEGKATADAPGFTLPRYEVTDSVSFARAVNFGPKGGELAIAAAMEDASPMHEIPDAALAVDFEDDMVAEEVEDGADAVALAEPPVPQAPVAPARSAAQAVPVPSADLAPSAVIPPVAVEQPAAPKEEKKPVAVAPLPKVEDAAKPAEPAPAADPSPLAGPEPVEATYLALGRRDGKGDWVTAHFDKPLVPREQTRVAVLGYHNFSNTKPVTEMRMRTSEFCRQMQYIRNAGLSVITMQDFIEWRFGKRCLPERCILITIDDGWKSVYTDAYPVLKAYGYPFTMYLYTRYIDVHGDSMSGKQIKEMLAHGATVGSHSSNHLYPKSWKRKADDPVAYAGMVQEEIDASGVKLRKMFGACSTYCYPGGYHTPPMIEALQESDSYKLAFTVIESKVDCNVDPWQVSRYMVFGVNPNIFRRAVNFDGEAGIVPTRLGIAAAIKDAREFFPKAFEGLKDDGGHSISRHLASKVNQARSKAKSKPAAAPAEGAATPAATPGSAPSTTGD